MLTFPPRLRAFVNSFFPNQDPFSVIVRTSFTLLFVYSLNKTRRSVLKNGIIGTIQLLFLSMIKKMPGGNKLIQAELDKTKQDLIKSLKPPTSKHKVYYDLPSKGVERKLLRSEMLYQIAQETSLRTKRGHGGVYVSVADKYKKYVSKDNNDKNYSKIVKVIDDNFSIKEEAYLYFSHTNILYPFLFPGTRKFDLELISMASKMLNAKEPAGNITSGGTESIFLAMKCWRTYAEKMNGIGGLGSGVVPNIVLCHTAHPAFVKACHYLQIEARFVDFHKSKELFGTVDLKKLEAAIDKNTICIVGSAPCFGYCVVDDIDGICRIAKKHGNIPVHVDNCLGGFLLSFLYDANVIDQAFDFRVDGVCSISCDMHKQAGADKGCSAVLYSKFEYRQYQYYAFVDWPGGLYCSPGFQGSANGGLKAVAWATLLSKGKDKLKADALSLYNKVKHFCEEINSKVQHCEVLGNPIACGVAFTFHGPAKDYDYAIAEAMKEIGHWEVNCLQFPKCLFFQAGQIWIDELEQYVIDLNKAVEIVISNPSKYKKKGMAGVYGTAATFPDRSLVAETVLTYLDVIHTPY